MARQGVAYPMVDDVRVADPKTMMSVPRDGETVGEIMVRSNTVMKGYLKNSGATGKLRGDRDQGPLKGHHHFRWRKHLQSRGRRSLDPAPLRDAGSRRGAARREMGRDALRLRRIETGCFQARRCRGLCLLQKPSRPFQGPQDAGLRSLAQDVNGQNPEIPAARAGEVAED